MLIAKSESQVVKRLTNNKTYTGATERSSVDVSDDACRSFPHLILFFSLQPQLAYVNLLKTSVAIEGYHVVFTSNFRMNRKAGCRSGHSSRVMCRGWSWFVAMLSVASV